MLNMLSIFTCLHVKYVKHISYQRSAVLNVSQHYFTYIRRYKSTVNGADLEYAVTAALALKFTLSKFVALVT